MTEVVKPITYNLKKHKHAKNIQFAKAKNAESYFTVF